MTPFIWVLLTLSSFRLTRLITTDDLTAPVRLRLERHLGTFFSKLINCMWCCGIYVTAAVFCEYHYLSVIPIWIYAAIAASSVVGYLGNFDE